MVIAQHARQTPRRVLRWILLGATAGAWAGFFVGGGVGRMAMFVLRLTSNDRLHGIDTDDGFKIGSFTTSTLFLMMFCGFFGAITGLIYVGARWVMPAQFRIPAAAVLGALLGGALILHSDGRDFRVLEPLPLAVVMFTVVPGLTVAAIAWLVERWNEWWFVRGKRTGMMSAPLLFPVTLIGLAITAVVVVPALTLASKSRSLTNVVRRYGPPIGQVAFVVVASLSAWALANDVTTIL